MAEDGIRRTGRNAPISGPDFPGLEDGTGSGFTVETTAAVKVDELKELEVHNLGLFFN